MAKSHIYLYVSLFSLIVAVVLFITRSIWLAKFRRDQDDFDDDFDLEYDLPASRRFGSRFLSRLQRYVHIPGSFQSDLEEGFNSENFNIMENIENGDTRAGLKDEDKAEIRKIMNEKKCDFDRARRIMNARRMRAAGIDPRTGMSIDPKAVFFS